LQILVHHTEKFTFWRSNGSSVYFKTFAGTERSPNARELLLSLICMCTLQQQLQSTVNPLQRYCF